MNEFVSKPIRKNTLIEVLTKALVEHGGLEVPVKVPVVSVPSIAPAQKQLPVTPPAEVALTDVATVLDRGAFQKLIEEIDLDGVRATFDVFLAETRERLALLKKLSCDNDRARIRDEAHTLKGSSGTFGLRQVMELAKTIEHSAPTITAETFQNLLSRLEASFNVASDEAESALSLAMAS